MYKLAVLATAFDVLRQLVDLDSFDGWPIWDPGDDTGCSSGQLQATSTACRMFEYSTPGRTQCCRPRL